MKSLVFLQRSEVSTVKTACCSSDVIQDTLAKDFFTAKKSFHCSAVQQQTEQQARLCRVNLRPRSTLS